MARPENLKQSLLQWLGAHPGVFGHEDEGEQVLLAEHGSGKTLTLRWSDIEDFREAQASGESYLNLVLRSGHQLVLARQGFVFPPDFSNTGPLELPVSVFCLQDLRYMFGLVETGLSEPSKETVATLMVCLATIDGAKAVGLKMDAEERRAEALLARLENRG